MAIRIPNYIFSHERKIANLYKRYLRLLEGQHFYREAYRYQARVARAEFDAIYYEKDPRKSKRLLMEQEAKLHNFALPAPVLASSPGGVAHERDIMFQDWQLDFWHPLEKAMYPEYFAKREVRKQQYISMWEKLHGPPKPEDH